jgi:phage FluMu protein Com
VASLPGKGELFEVDCPHCHRHFRGKLLAGGSAQHAGFKCPHCKLFVAYERTAESARAAD